MYTPIIYDLIGIGIGPFNLGLAALSADIPEFKCLFIEKNEQFNWHPGMLLPTAKMQVPFYADLVTLADPCNRFTYLAYLKAIGRLFKFAVNEAHIPYRSEFNGYCKWVAAQLNNLHFGQICMGIIYHKSKKLYSVHTEDRNGNKQVLHGKHIVVGIGTEPAIPSCATKFKAPSIFHSSEYLQRKSVALMNKNITVIGSGQSAAEIILDLLPYTNDKESLCWFTRSPEFFPMNYSKLALEMSSPEYIQYFYSLDEKQKVKTLKGQQYLHKGINLSLIEEMYEQLYLNDLQEGSKLPQFFTNCELKDISPIKNNEFRLSFIHAETGKQLISTTNAVILATGYQYLTPSYMAKLKHEINWTKDGKYQVNENYSVDSNNSFFVQNAETHTHGFNSADIGLGPYRNAVILNAILKREYYKIEQSGNTFQHFSL